MANATAVFTPGQRISDITSYASSGAYAEFYEAGSTTPKQVFADAELTVSLGPTIYTDSVGYPVTSFGGTTKTLVYTDDASYKITIKTSAGVTIAEHDNCKGAVVASAAPGGSFLTQDAGDVRYTRNANALAAITNLAAGDTIPHWSAANAGNRGITWADFQADLLSEWRTAGHVFSAGARLVFQGAPPTGWTLESGAAYNDAALKFTTGTPGTGGTAAFSTTFASRTPTGTVGGGSLTTAQLAAHTHTDTKKYFLALVGSGPSTAEVLVDGTSPSVTGDQNSPTTSSSAGSGTTHTHSFTGNAMDFAVKFASVNIGQKA